MALSVMIVQEPRLRWVREGNSLWQGGREGGRREGGREEGGRGEVGEGPSAW